LVAAVSDGDVVARVNELVDELDALVRRVEA